MAICKGGSGRILGMLPSDIGHIQQVVQVLLVLRSIGIAPPLSLVFLVLADLGVLGGLLLSPRAERQRSCPVLGWSLLLVLLDSVPEQASGLQPILVPH